MEKGQLEFIYFHPQESLEGFLYSYEDQTTNNDQYLAGLQEHNSEVENWLTRFKPTLIFSAPVVVAEITPVIFIENKHYTLIGKMTEISISYWIAVAVVALAQLPCALRLLEKWCRRRRGFPLT